MRVSTIFMTVTAMLLAVAGQAGMTAPVESTTGLDWVRPYTESPSAATKGMPTTSSAWPAALIETNYYAFESGGDLTQEVFLSTRANGYTGPVTVYFYWQNADTGDKRYFNTFQGLLPVGEVADLFGFGDDPLKVFAPTVSELKLFGDAGAFGAAPDLPLGHYAWVIEIRDANDDVLARDYALYSVVGQVEALSANVTTDTTWTADTLYVMQDAVFVQSGATLTIEPGTVVLGTGSNALIVEPGSKLMAVGTEMKPIVFTSAQERGERGAGDWGGIILAGNAPLNVGGDGTSQVEGAESVVYGGDDPNDSSGMLRYLRIEFGGFEFSADNELNGLSLHGVGDGTVIDHVQVIRNEDDAIEWFGGTVNVKYAVFTGNADDSIDCTEGAQFKVQFAVVVQEGLDADHGIEFDSWEFGEDNEPRATGQMYNVTLIGSGDTGPKGDDGMKLRRGFAGNLHNFIVYGFRETGLDIDSESTYVQANNGGLVFANSIMFNNGSWTGQPNIKEDAEGDWQGSDVWFLQDQEMNRAVDPMLASPFFSSIKPNLAPLPGSPAREASYVQAPPSDGFFDQVDFIGGVNPNDDWTQAPWVNWSLK